MFVPFRPICRSISSCFSAQRVQFLLFSSNNNQLFEMPPKRKPRAASKDVALKNTSESVTEPTTTPSKRLKVEEKMSIKSNGNGHTDSVGPQTIDETTVPRAANGKCFNLKIVSWNVNGARAVLKKEDALKYLRTEACDILALQETKCNTSTFPAELAGLDRFPHKYYAFSNQDGYAGVALLSRVKPLSVQYGLGHDKHDTEGRVITAFYEKFILVNTYTPNAGQGLKRLDYRMGWDKDFREYLSNLDKVKPVVLCGDLNVSHKEIDIENPKSNVKNAGFTPEERASFSTLLAAGFVDSFRHLYPDKAKCYTFWSFRSRARARNVGWRLDYFVISARLVDNVCDNTIRSDVMGSDHCPIVLYLAL